MDRERRFKELLKKQKSAPTGETMKALFKTIQTMPLFIGKSDRGIYIAKGRDGETLLPVFTSKEGCGALNPETVEQSDFTILKQYVLLPDVDIQGLVINPSKENLALKKEDILYMDQQLTGMTLERSDRNRALELRPPVQVLPMLKEKLVEFCSENENIHRLHLLEGRREENEPFHKIFFVDFDGRDTELFPVLGEKLRVFMEPGSVFELMEWSDAMGELPYMEDGILYEKK